MKAGKKIDQKGKTVMALALCITAICVLWFVLRPDSINVQNKDPELYVNAQNLILNLEEKAWDSVGLIPEKIVEIQGRIKEINERNNRLTIILGMEDIEHPSIICDMNKSQKEYIKSLSVNDSITIKGIYKGFLKDAIFLNCIVSYE